MSRRPKALLFDLGNVCLPFDHGRMVRQVAELFAAPARDVESALLGGTTLADIECGRMTDAELHRSLCSQLGVDVPASDLFRAASDIFMADPQMEDLLAELSGCDLPLILVSNTSGPHIEFVREEFTTLSHFDTLVLSYEVGAAKPERAFYDRAFDAAGCRPEECFYTDDILAYVDAAREIGVDAEVFCDAAILREQLVERKVL